MDAGYKPDGIEMLAKLGTSGKHPGNLEKELHRKVENLHGFVLEVYWIKITLANLNSLGSQQVLVPVFLPFEMFAAAWGAGWHQFERSATGHRLSALHQYWENAMRLPWGQNHPLARTPENFPFAVPVAYFIDGGEFSDGSSATVTTISSIACGRGHAYDKSFLLSVLPEDRLIKDTSMKELTDFLNWCAHILLSGKMPHTGYYGEEFPMESVRFRRRGQPIAAQYVFAFSAMLCDNKQKVIRRADYQSGTWFRTIACHIFPHEGSAAAAVAPSVPLLVVCAKCLLLTHFLSS